MARKHTGLFGAVVFAVMGTLAFGDNAAPPAPESLLCTAPKERGMQYFACDMFKKYGEPVSPVTHAGQTRLAVRVAYIPSFSASSSIRVEFVEGTAEPGDTVPPETQVFMTVSTTQEKGRIYSKTFALTWEEVWLLRRSMHLPEALNWPNVDESKKMGCLDGTYYVVEFADGPRYHWLYLGCDDEDNPRTSLHSMVNLLGVIARAHDSEGLKGFPGY